MEKQISELLEMIKTGLLTATSITKEQLPIIAQEIIKYNLCISLIWAILLFIIAVVVFS